MDKEIAKRMVRETFENPFNRERYIHFLRNLLNEYEESEERQLLTQFETDAYCSYVRTYERIGTFTDRNKRKIDLLIVYLQRHTTLERARTSQRNFVARYLKDRGQKDAALVAFVSPSEEDWRFSFVKMEYQLARDARGDIKATEEFTPARRYSFIVGKNESSHTAQSRLVPVLANDEQLPTFEEIQEAFNVERVTKEFFEKYRALFIRTKHELDRVLGNDARVRADFEHRGIDTVNFSKKLLGQIVFLYYLQKKGWFGVPRDAAWGEGSRGFLRELFDGKHGDYANFFNHILEPLFYDALRNDRSHDDHYYCRFNCRIPFLNGGLFDPMNSYDWVRTDILLPNTLFSNRTKTDPEGDGILDVFDLYNFTVKEDEPFEKEVAIDPELLGKAYEKFNAIRPDNYDEFLAALGSGKKGEESKFNKQYGVYYTPREIVHFMCQQSLISYLYTALNGNVAYQKLGDAQLDMYGNSQKTGQTDLMRANRAIVRISKEDIALFIRQGDPWHENNARAIAEGKQSRSRSHEIPESIRMNAALVDQKLANVKVCDPAVGSGAFPVGMMTEIIRARQCLMVWTRTSKTSYDLKRECIENSLYGVDIDPGAVEIAKLRLWLSLVVDEDDPRNIKPLPNLDYKVVCGNSLIGFPENWGSPVVKEIELLIHQHFSETNPSRKEKLKQQIDEKIEARYRTSVNVFGYQVNFDFATVFAEVFHSYHGFDILIANPPYVTIALGKKQKFYTESESAVLRTLFADVFEYKGNTFALFLCKSVRLLNANGTLSFIVPNTLLLNSTLAKTRTFILKYCDVETLVNFKGSVFEEAETGGNLVLILDRHKNSHRKTQVLECVTPAELSDYPDYQTVDQEVFEGDGERRFMISGADSNLMSKFGSGTIPLGDIVKFYQGIITGDNKKFLVRKKSDPKHEAILRGRDINRYYYCFDSNYVLFDPRKLWSNTNEKMFHVKEKIISRQTGSQLVGAYDRNGYLSLDSTHVQIPTTRQYDLKYILALFNSRLLNYYYECMVKETGRVFAQVKLVYLRKLPMKVASPAEQLPLIRLVERILAAKESNPQADTSVYEAKIDRFVYGLYGLTAEEIGVVEGQRAAPRRGEHGSED